MGSPENIGANTPRLVKAESAETLLNAIQIDDRGPWCVSDTTCQFGVRYPITIADADALKMLARWDTAAPRGVLNSRDFVLPNGQIDREHLRGLIGAALIPEATTAASINQQQAVLEFLNLSHEISYVQTVALGWVTGPEAVTDVSTITMEPGAFARARAATWSPAFRALLSAMAGGDYTSDEINGPPALTKAYLEDLSRRALSVFIRLSGTTDPGNLVIGKGCNEIRRLTYNETAIPAPLQDQVRSAAARFGGAMETFSELDYILCVGDGCPDNDTIKLDFNGATLLKGIEPSTQITFDLGGCDSGGPYCFTGEAVLRTENGALISFNELAALKAAGQPLPKIASFNETTGVTIFQQPRDLIDHGVVTSDLLRLNLTESNGAAGTLEVTSEHRLLVMRDGAQRWIHAGALHEHDQLVNPDGRQYTFEMLGSMSMEGSQHLFNLSFGMGQQHNFEISSDGGAHWFVAHNLK